MSTHTSFAIFGTGGIGSFIIDEFLKLKENGAISTVKIASRSVSLKNLLAYRWHLRPADLWNCRMP